MSRLIERVVTFLPFKTGQALNDYSKVLVIASGLC